MAEAGFEGGWRSLVLGLCYRLGLGNNLFFPDIYLFLPLFSPFFTSFC